MPRLIAKKDTRYASRNLKAGEEFDASISDAIVLVQTGIADHAVEPDPKKSSRNRYRRSDLRAEED